MSRLKDIETTAIIKLALVTNPHVGGLDIGVHSVNGIVFLTGVVQDTPQKELAEEIARAHGGIDIKNDIQVLSEMSTDIIREVAGYADEFSSEDVSLRNRVLGDMESDSRVNAIMVNVEEAGGIVRLSGIQETEKARERAEEIARRVEGVREVINDIEVRQAVGHT